MTTKQLRRLLDLVQSHGWSVPRAAAEVGVSPAWARACLRRHGIRPSRRRDRAAWYAAYRRGDDALVAFGTLQDLCRALTLTPATVRNYASTGKGRYYIIRLEDDRHD